MRVRDPVDYSKICLKSYVAFMFVIGLSIEEPAFKRTTT